jgi:hypothetical protein
VPPGQPIRRGLRKVCAYAIDRIGFAYDLKNITDLLRYMLPLPIPQRWRRRMISLGSGDPSRLICSTLIAQAFEAVRYPILPRVTLMESWAARREILHIRHSSLYAPRRHFSVFPGWSSRPSRPTSITRNCLGATCRRRRRTPNRRRRQRDRAARTRRILANWGGRAATAH